MRSMDVIHSALLRDNQIDSGVSILNLGTLRNWLRELKSI